MGVSFYEAHIDIRLTRCSIVYNGGKERRKFYIHTKRAEVIGAINALWAWHAQFFYEAHRVDWFFENMFLLMPIFLAKSKTTKTLRCSRNKTQYKNLSFFF